MGLLSINLREVLLAENELVQQRFISVRRQRHLWDQEVQKLVCSKSELRDLSCPQDTDAQEALRLLGISGSAREQVPEDQLPAHRIVHFEAIRKICMDYGLVFRPFRSYKGQLAKEVAIEVLRLKTILGHDPITTRFFIAAPKEMFCDCLTPNDPFLFYEIGPDEYYLVHQWGLDTSPLRLIAHWPRGTRKRLFATRTVFCLLALVGLFVLREDLAKNWAEVGTGMVLACWARFAWEYRYKRGVHERRWYRAS